jgi:hypothetical protein
VAHIIPVEIKVEQAPGADLDGDPAAWSWVDVTNRTTAGSRVKVFDDKSNIKIGRGAQSERANSALPSTLDYQAANPDGAMTPDRAESIWYPNIDVGMPARVSVKEGSPHLSLPGVAGASASTPDAASLDVVGDLFLAWDVTFTTGRRSPVFVAIGNKYGAAGQRSWLLYVSTDGAIRFRWSADGTNVLDEASAIPMPIDLNGRMVGAVYLDVNDTLGNHVTTWYTSDSRTYAGPWTALASLTTAGTTSIFSSTAPVELGTSNNTSPPVMEVNAFEMRAGTSAGTVVANPNFAAQTPGATSFADTAAVPKTWTINGAATIDNWQRRVQAEATEIAPALPSGNLPGNSDVSVQASGALHRLGQGDKPLNSALYRRITSPEKASNVFAYWSFEDGADSTSIASPIAGVAPMTISGEYTFANDSAFVGSKPLLVVASGENAYMEAPVPAIPQVVGVAWTVTRFFRITDPAVSPANTQLMAVDTTGRVATWRITINDTQVAVSGLDADEVGVVLDTFPSDPVFFGDEAQIYLQITDNGANVDWAVRLIPFPGSGVYVMSGSYAGNTGVPVGFRNSLTGPPSGVTVGHLTFSTGLNAGWPAPADSGFAGEPATSRIERLCREEGIPHTIDGSFGTGWLEVAANVPRMGPQRPLALLDLLEEAAVTDGGILTEMLRAPGIAYRSRHTMLNQPVRLTWDVAARGVINPLKPTRNDEALRNDITVTRTGGSSAREVDPFARVLYDEAVEVNVQLDSALPSQAGWRLRIGSWPGMRWTQVPLELEFNGDLINDWVKLCLGDRFQITNLPTPEFPTPDIDLLVVGYTESFWSGGWTARLICVPAGPFTVGEVQDSVLGRADTAGSELTTAVTSSATSWPVATTSWPPWRSTAGGASFPFDVAAAGEEATVSAISDIVATFGAVGTATHGVNASVTPGAPAGVVVGSLLFILAGIRNLGAGTVNVPSGWTRLPLFNDDENVALLGRIAQANGEAMPLITFSGGVALADTSAQCARFGGTYHDVSNLPVTWGRVGSLSAQDIVYPATRVPYPNSLVLYVGWKSDDWTSVATIAGATEIGEPSTATGSDQGLVWDYLIQTTATDIADGSFVVTGGAAGITLGGVIVLRPDVQTFTVARSANGVIKAQTAGTDVNLADPMVASF